MMMYADAVQPFENTLVVCHTDGRQGLRLKQCLEETQRNLPYHEDLETRVFEDLGSWAV
jgi:hypothetical protein